MHCKGSGDIANRLAFFEQALCELALIVIHFLRSPEANTSFLCISAAGAGAFADQVAFKLGYMLPPYGLEPRRQRIFCVVLPAPISSTRYTVHLRNSAKPKKPSFFAATLDPWSSGARSTKASMLSRTGTAPTTSSSSASCGSSGLASYHA